MLSSAVAAVGVVAEDDQPSGSANGSAFSITPWTTLKMAVLAPMASAMVPMHTAREAGAAPQQADRGTEVLGEGANHAEGLLPVVGHPGRRVGPPRRRVAAFAPGEAEQRGQLTRRQPGHGQPPAQPARLVELLVEHVGQLGAEPRPRVGGQQPQRGGVEAAGEPGHGQVRARHQPLLPRHLDGALQPGGLGAGHRQPGRQQAVVAPARVVVAGTGPRVELVDEAGVEEPLERRVERAGGEAAPRRRSAAGRPG